MHVVAVDLVEARIMNVIRAAIDSPCLIGSSGRLGASVKWDGRPQRQSDQKRFGKHALIVNHKPSLQPPPLRPYLDSRYYFRWCSRLGRPNLQTFSGKYPLDRL